jgi:hypothetical protein
MQHILQKNTLHTCHSYDILGAGMLWKPKDLHKICQNLLKFIKIR